MKLCYVNINTEKASQPYIDFQAKLFRKIARPDTEIDFKSVSPGLERISDGHPYFFFLNERSVIERVIEAEEEGYDAAVVGCFLDPGVSVVRGVVNIPVIGLCESTLHFACQLGRKFAIISPDIPSIISATEDKIRIHGLQDRAITHPVRGITMSMYDVFNKGLQKPEVVAEDIAKNAEKCVEEGADAVIVGCNGLAPFCTASGAAKVGENEIPLIDCVAVGIKTAEMIVDLNKQLGLPFISRAGFYSLPRQKDLDRVRSTFGL